MVQPRPSETFADQLLKAIQGEHEAIQFYTTLEQLAPPAHKRYIRSIREDERADHFAKFSNLYRSLTGHNPRLTNATLPKNYVSGLKQAIDDEQNAAKFYTEIYTTSRDPYVRSIFFDAIADEMRHATRLSFLYSNYFLENGRI